MNHRNPPRLRLLDAELTATQVRVGEAILAELRALRCDVQELIATTRGSEPIVSDETASGAQDALPPLMTIRKAGALLRTTPRALYMRIRRGAMPGVVRVGRRRLMVKTASFCGRCARYRLGSSRGHRRLLCPALFS